MPKNRLEAFTDGVIAIIITIMVMELKVPHGEDLSSLLQLQPIFLSYALSFLYVGIYWNNHHHMLLATKNISSRVLWANLNLLFWPSLLPFSIGWMGESHFARWPVALLGINLLLAAIAYTLLLFNIVHHHGRDSKLAEVIDGDTKGRISLAFFAASIIAAFFIDNWLGFFLLFVPAAIWLIPDRRMEKAAR